MLLRCIGDEYCLYYEFAGRSSNTHGLRNPVEGDVVWNFWQSVYCDYPFCRNCSIRDTYRFMVCSSLKMKHPLVICLQISLSYKSPSLIEYLNFKFRRLAPTPGIPLRGGSSTAHLIDLPIDYPNWKKT